MAKKQELETKLVKIKKDGKASEKKVKKDKKKEGKQPKESFFYGIKSELSKVKWPSRQEVFKYTVATIVFVIVLVAFFILMSLIMAMIKEAFN